MKAISLAIALFFLGQSVQACLNAQQARIFPIGKCDKGLIVLEMALNRGSKEETKGYEFIPAWYGKSYLNIYDAQQLLVHTEIVDSHVYLVGETYIADLQLAMEKVQNIVKSKFSSGFLPAEIQEIVFTDYDLTIAGAELVKDTIDMRISLQLDQGTMVDLNMFKNSLKSVQSYVNIFLRWEYDQNREMQMAVISGLRIGSVRTFLVGEETFQIYHLGSGQKLQSADPNQKRETPVVHVEGQLYDEPVLHHGQGFDFLIWL